MTETVTLKQKAKHKQESVKHNTFSGPISFVLCHTWLQNVRNILMLDTTIMVYLEKGKHDHQLTWPMPELDYISCTQKPVYKYRGHSEVDVIHMHAVIKGFLCTMCHSYKNTISGEPF